jgi:hypothetical protein
MVERNLCLSFIKMLSDSKEKKVLGTTIGGNFRHFSEINLLFFQTLKFSIIFL